MFALAVLVGMKEDNVLSNPSSVNLQFFKLKDLIFLDNPRFITSKFKQSSKFKLSKAGRLVPVKDFK